MQQSIRVPKGSTPKTVGELAAEAVVAAAGSAAAEVASGHTLVVAWLSSAEGELARQVRERDAALPCASAAILPT